MVYLLIIAILFASELVYFRIADRFNIIDKPNERSSHTRVTLRGGGVIYWVAALLYLLFNPSDTAGWFFAGITLMAGVSFWDDVKGLGQKVRLLFHLLASAPFTFYQILANERGMDHRLVSVIYFVVQLVCSALIIVLYPTLGWWIFTILAAVLVGVYGFKFRLMRTAKE